MNESHSKVIGVLARYENPLLLLKAAEAVRDRGYKRFDCYTPFPVHGLDKAMGLRPSILGWIVFLAGVGGFALAVVMQWYPSAVDYPLVVAGKPYNSWPAFVPITFELTVLLSALAAVGGMLALNGLPRWHHPLFSSEQFQQVTDDAFFLAIEAEGDSFDPQAVQDFLESVGGTNVEFIRSDA